MQQQRFIMICITAECSSVFTVNVKVFQRQEQLREFRCEKQSRTSLSERLGLDHWTPEKWSRVTEHSADINNEATLCSLWFLLSDQHVRRLRSDPAGLRQTGLQPGPAAGSVSWPGEDEAVAADGGGRPLDDGVHALLLRPAEVETGSSPDPDSWKPGFLIGEQIGDSGAAAGVRLFSWNNKRTTSSRYSPTEPPSPSHLLREQSDWSQDVGRAADREFSLFSKWGAFKV